MGEDGRALEESTKPVRYRLSSETTTNQGLTTARESSNLLLMRVIHTPAGQVNVCETGKDQETLRLWLRKQHTVAVDTETTHLHIGLPDFKVRLVQFGNPQEAFVVPAQSLGYVYYDLLVYPKRLVWFNAGFDIRALFPGFAEPRHRAWLKSVDAGILTHLVDPRDRKEGGSENSLAEAAAVYCPEVPKEGDALKEEFLRLRKEGAFPEATFMDDRFREMPIDNEVYLRYAGLDAIITARVYLGATKALSKLYPDSTELATLLRKEHQLAEIVSEVDHRGTLLDVTYTTQLGKNLAETEESLKLRVMDEYELKNWNSTAQLRVVLEKQGIICDQTTDKGNVSITDTFLADYAEHPLVDMVVQGKKAGKWRKTWVENFLKLKDYEGRVHPSTNTLRARTARFSVTGIPAQTLPATDSMIRSCFVAEPGHQWVAVDYSNQELRYAAAVSQDQRMIQAFKNNEDLHLITAEAAFPGRGKEMRSYGKLTNFATLYGVGANGLSKQTGLSVQECRTLLKAFRESYPTLNEYGRNLASTATLTGRVVTRTGRRLPVDPARSYSALNYYVQSGCRDITAQAILNLWDAGFGKYIRLAIHDELDFSLPEGFDDWDSIRKCMETRVDGVYLPVEIRVGQQSWGSLYSDA